MSSYQSEIKTFRGLTCIFLEKPLPCDNMKCKRKCRRCDACGMKVEDSVYHCPDEDKDFHAKCTNLKTEMCIDDVVFRLQDHGKSKCLWCKKHILKGTRKKIPGMSYVSNYKKFTIHVNCILQMVKKHGNSNSSLPLPQQSKNVSNNNNNPCWLNALTIFFKAVLTILIGDPTTIVASTLADLVTSLCCMILDNA